MKVQVVPSYEVHNKIDREKAKNTEITKNGNYKTKFISFAYYSLNYMITERNFFKYYN